MRDIKKQLRFRRPEFQEKLARARKYVRKQTPVASSFWGGRRILTVVLLLLIIYFLTTSPLFLVDKVVVRPSGAKAEQIQAAIRQMRKRIVYLIPGNHILILNKQNLLHALQKELPEIRQVTSLKKALPDRIEISLEEREPRYIWQSSTDFYLLDQDGVVFQKIIDYKPLEFSQTLITDRLAGSVIVGENLEIQKILNFIEQVKLLWQEHIDATNYTGFSIAGKRSLDVFSQTGIGFLVYFDINRSAKRQLENLSLLLNQEIKPETYSGLSYVDVRLPNIAYYCYLDAPCAPEFARKAPKL